MSNENEARATEDITCDECGKFSGNEQVGTSWICADCKVSNALQDE